MSLRTVENLYDRLSDEMAWRRKELTDVRALIETSSFTTSKRDALIRAGIALMYAHWEGFIKAAATAYLEFVSMQRMRYDEIAPNFIAISVKGKLNEAAGAHKAAIHNKVVEFFLNNMSDRCTIPYKTVVNTKANLSSTVLQNIIAMLGLDYAFYQTKEKLIDEKLLASRNNIAHGEFLQVTLAEYIELHDQITTMMNQFRTDIDNSANLNKFKRT